MYYNCRLVLRRGLEEERTETLSEKRQRFSITVHFSSNKMKFRSALQISLQEM